LAIVSCPTWTRRACDAAKTFDVIEREEQHLLGMVYATLSVRSLVDGRKLRIVNAHLLMSRAG
jgi:hypothetical protein